MSVDIQSLKSLLLCSLEGFGLAVAVPICNSSVWEVEAGGV